jgi:ABC-2 type transport system ATP-binding protein
MTTHYMEEAEFCDRIAIIDRGKIVASGTPDELKKLVGGDVVTITAEDAAGLAAEIDRAFSLAAVVDQDRVRLEVPDGPSFVPRLMREINQPVQTLTLSRPSLDDVFIKLTGHAIRDEGADQLSMMRGMAQVWTRSRR